MNIPQDLYYTRDHEWVRLEGDTAYVGLTEFAQAELGDIVFVEVGELGTFLPREEVLGTVEAVKTVSDLFMPLSGTLLEVNPLLEEQPEWVNQAPYGEGWIVKLAVEQPAEVAMLLDAAAYAKLTE